MKILTKIFKNNKRKEIKTPIKRKIEEKNSFHEISLEKPPIPLVIIDKKKIIKEFNTLAKEEFDLKNNSNITHIIRNPIFVNNINVAITRNIKKTFILEYDSKVKKLFNVFIDSFENKFLISFIDSTKIYKLEKFKSDFIGNMSHELKTPLAIIFGIVETFMYQKKISVKEKKTFLNTLNHETKRMQNIVEDLLSLSRIEIDEHIFPKNKIKIHEIVKTVCDSFLLKAKKRKIKIKLEAPKEMPPIQGDENQLHQLFENLIDNSIKYSNLNSQIQINIKLNKKMKKIFIIINDESPGISERLIPRITERFYRLDSSVKVEGTGLGLSIVKHIANKHRAIFEITSVINKGSSFKLIFPYNTKFNPVTY